MYNFDYTCSSCKLSRSSSTFIKSSISVATSTYKYKIKFMTYLVNINVYFKSIFKWNRLKPDWCSTRMVSFLPNLHLLWLLHSNSNENINCRKRNISIETDLFRHNMYTSRLTTIIFVFKLPKVCNRCQKSRIIYKYQNRIYLMNVEQGRVIFIHIFNSFSYILRIMKIFIVVQKIITVKRKCTLLTNLIDKDLKIKIWL